MKFASSLNAIIAVTFALLAASCVPTYFSEPVAPRISGTVVNASKKPLSGVHVEYLYRSERVLGHTTTGNDGSFTLGPFSQRFYLVYLGSPGFAPVPYWLKYSGQLPDVIRISCNGATGIYLCDTQAKFGEKSRTYSGIGITSRVKLPSPARWIGGNSKLTLTPNMRDSTLPLVSYPSRMSDQESTHPTIQGAP